jgi:hypothetical protein
MRKTFVLYFFISFLFLFITFIVCIFEAYGFDEGTIETSNAQTKHKIIGCITYIGRYLGDNYFNESKIFASFIIQFSIFIDAFIISVTLMVVNFMIVRIKTAANSAQAP